MKVSDKSIYFPSEVTIPLRGESFIDPVFNTKITRVSNAVITTDPGYGDGRKYVNIIPEYSSMGPFNTDDTYFLLQHFSNFAIYALDKNGAKFFRNCPYRVGASSEPRWTNDPNIFIFLAENKILYYQVKEDKILDYWVFTEYKSIFTKGETDLSEDGRYLPLCGLKPDGSKEIFLFDCLNKTKGMALQVSEGFNQLYVTPKNNVIIGWNAEFNNLTNLKRYGAQLYDKNMNFVYQLTDAIGHMDTVRHTLRDEEFLVWCSSDEKKENKNAIIAINLANNSRKNLLELDWSLAVHISAIKDSIIVSTYNPKILDPKVVDSWKPYTNEIIRITSVGEIQRLCHHRSLPLDSYVWSSKATINRKGNKLLFASNFGIKPWLYYADTYLIELEESLLPTPVLNSGDLVFSLDMYNLEVKNKQIILKRL